MKVFFTTFARAVNSTLRRLIRLYQLIISPLFALFDAVGGGCRFQPTCSRYCMEALETHGTLRGLWLGLKRLGRCAPWGGMGLDPVPPPRPSRVRAVCSVSPVPPAT